MLFSTPLLPPTHGTSVPSNINDKTPTSHPCQMLGWYNFHNGCTYSMMYSLWYNYNPMGAPNTNTQHAPPTLSNMVVTTMPAAACGPFLAVLLQ